MVKETKWLRISGGSNDNNIKPSEVMTKITAFILSNKFNYKRSVYYLEPEIDLNKLDPDFKFDEKDLVYYISNKDGYKSVRSGFIPWNASESKVIPFDNMKYSVTTNKPIDYDYDLLIFPDDCPSTMNRFAITTAIETGDHIKFTEHGFSLLYRFGVDGVTYDDCPRYYVQIDYTSDTPICKKDTAEHVAYFVESRKNWKNETIDYFKEILNTDPSYYGRVTGDVVNCRIGPGITYDIVMQVDYGQKVKICDCMEDISGHKWYYCIIKHDYVFIVEDYIKITRKY